MLVGASRVPPSEEASDKQWCEYNPVNPAYVTTYIYTRLFHKYDIQDCDKHNNSLQYWPAHIEQLTGCPKVTELDSPAFTDFTM